MYDSSGEDLVDWVTRRENEHQSGESGQRLKIRNVIHHHHHLPPNEEEKNRSAEESGGDLSD